MIQIILITKCMNKWSSGFSRPLPLDLHKNYGSNTNWMSIKSYNNRSSLYNRWWLTPQYLVHNDIISLLNFKMLFICGTDIKLSQLVDSGCYLWSQLWVNTENMGFNETESPLGVDTVVIFPSIGRYHTLSSPSWDHRKLICH